MKKLFSFLFIVFSFNALAQVPEPAMVSLKGIGGSADDGINTNVTKTADGGFILNIGTVSIYNSGNIDSFCSLNGNRSIFLKYNSDASILEWSKCYEWDGDTTLTHIFPTNDGGFVLGGNYKGTWGMYICKQDALGNIIWSHGYSKGSGLYLSSMIATDNGGYFLAGESYYADTNVSIHYGSFTEGDFFVLKVDSIGNKVWGKVIGGTGDESLASVASTTDGGCYIVGETMSNDYDCTGNHGEPDAYIARLDKNGNILWHRDMGGTAGDGAGYVVADGKGGVIIAGATASTDGDVTHSFGTGGEIWVINVDSSNHIVWNNCYGGGGYETSKSICKATDGSIWIAGISSQKGGQVDTVYGNGDAWFVHADSVGNFLNAKVIGSHLGDEGEMIYPLSNGNVIAGGYYSDSGGAFTNTYYGMFDVFLAVLAPWNQTGVKEINLVNNAIKIYPNPATEQVTIEVEQKGNYGITITDVVGRLIYKSSFIGTTKIAVNEWPRGMYSVQVTGEDGYRSVQKLVVQ